MAALSSCARSENAHPFEGEDTESGACVRAQLRRVAYDTMR
jgi:hypothetical protein